MEKLFIKDRYFASQKDVHSFSLKIHCAIKWKDGTLMSGKCNYKAGLSLNNIFHVIIIIYIKHYVVFVL